MTAPLSNDLRERVVAAIMAGESCRSVAARFGVAVSSAVKWSQRYRATGSVAPGRMGGHRKRVLDPHRVWSRHLLERVNGEAFGLCGPCLANELVRGEAVECLESAPEVVG